MTHKTLKIDDQQWWKSGVRFECQGSGKCCQSRGEYGYVFLTAQDRKNIARFLKLATSTFTKKYCDKNEDGFWHLKEDGKNPDCMFLEGGNRCGVYSARPAQCRTWPFWPEVMDAKTWNKEVASFCPGVGKGRLYSHSEIKKILLQQLATGK